MAEHETKFWRFVMVWTNNHVTISNDLKTEPLAVSNRVCSTCSMNLWCIVEFPLAHHVEAFHKDSAQTRWLSSAWLLFVWCSLSITQAHDTCHTSAQTRQRQHARQELLFRISKSFYSSTSDRKACAAVICHSGCVVNLGFIWEDVWLLTEANFSVQKRSRIISLSKWRKNWKNKTATGDSCRTRRVVF